MLYSTHYSLQWHQLHAAPELGIVFSLPPVIEDTPQLCMLSSLTTTPADFHQWVVQKRRNSSAAALELRLFSTNPLIYTYPLYAIRKHAIYPPAASNRAVTQTIGSVVFPSRANYMWYIIYSQQQI